MIIYTAKIMAKSEASDMKGAWDDYVDRVKIDKARDELVIS